MENQEKIFNINLRQIEFKLLQLSDDEQINEINYHYALFAHMKQFAEKNIKQQNKKIKLWGGLTAVNILLGVICLGITYFNPGYAGFAFASLLLGGATRYKQNKLKEGKQVLIEAKNEMIDNIKQFDEIVDNMFKEEQENTTTQTKEINLPVYMRQSKNNDKEEEQSR